MFRTAKLQSQKRTQKTIVVDAVSSILGGGVTFTACLINAMAKLRPNLIFYVVAGTDEFVNHPDDAAL